MEKRERRENMGWNIIRQATDEDRERLEASANRFVERHAITQWGDEPGVDTVAMAVYVWRGDERDIYLKKLWHRCAARALREKAAEGIAWDTVGYSAD